MRKYKRTLQEYDWFLLLILLLLAGLFLYIGNGTINILLEHYDNNQNSPIYQENSYNPPLDTNNLYLFCYAPCYPQI